jgi:hypothetical protein
MHVPQVQQCKDRTSHKRAKEKRELLEIEQQMAAIKKRNEYLSARAPLKAEERLKIQQVQERENFEKEIDALISKQTSSIEAMNVARLISPAFQEKFQFKPTIQANTKEDHRYKEIMRDSHVGQFYA